MVAVEVSTAAEDSTAVLRTLPAEALEAADSVEAALDPRSRLVLSLAQYSARHPVTMAAVTGQVTTTTHMPTITATAVVTITAMAAVTIMAMPLAMVSSASQEQFSVARTAADISANNEFKKAPDWALFLTSTNESRSLFSLPLKVSHPRTYDAAKLNNAWRRRIRAGNCNTPAREDV
jgi:hypothetical protein